MSYSQVDFFEIIISQLKICETAMTLNSTIKPMHLSNTQVSKCIKCPSASNAFKESSALSASQLSKCLYCLNALSVLQLPKCVKCLSSALHA